MPGVHESGPASELVVDVVDEMLVIVEEKLVMSELKTVVEVVVMEENVEDEVVEMISDVEARLDVAIEEVLAKDVVDINIEVESASSEVVDSETL
nr:uncharacterized protein CTRU02_11115 [Colletotrichum truncatum]KAF6786244.1 hypothetical protein CTRU02_11115 [Colletotrichum truncatum]